MVFRAAVFFFVGAGFLAGVAFFAGTAFFAADVEREEVVFLAVAAAFALVDVAALGSWYVSEPAGMTTDPAAVVASAILEPGHTSAFSARLAVGQTPVSVLRFSPQWVSPPLAPAGSAAPVATMSAP